MPTHSTLSRPGQGHGAPAGFTLIELIAAASVLAIAACGMSVAIVNAMSTSAVTRETAQARAAARQLMEQIQNIPVHDVFATFNTISTDDPLGPGTAPGGIFDIQTKPAAVQVSNMTGEILFPEAGVAGELREDVQDPILGMPRDLNGDGTIDNLNHALDYIVLPVRIRIRWQGVAGDRSLDLCGLLLRD